MQHQSLPRHPDQLTLVAPFGRFLMYILYIRPTSCSSTSKCIKLQNNEGSEIKHRHGDNQISWKVPDSRIKNIRGRELEIYHDEQCFT